MEKLIWKEEYTDELKMLSIALLMTFLKAIFIYWIMYALGVFAMLFLICLFVFPTLRLIVFGFIYGRFR